MHYRRPGEAVIPFIRWDLDSTRVASNLDSSDHRIEAGYGTLAMGYSQRRFRETEPDDTLEIRQLYGLYRMSLGPYVEFDLGMGSQQVKGQQHQSHFFATTPLLIHTSERFGFEFRPAWGGGIQSYDISLLVKSSYGSLKLGYKALSTRSESLNGPYLGFALHY
ncbi:hypothetical protein [Ferrimonas pelagia]|uniref:hypothetical protein n=1 Tax=Ferrimonas pelagia TaxID=1177826 RepID=UPI0031F0101A